MVSLDTLLAQMGVRQTPVPPPPPPPFGFGADARLTREGLQDVEASLAQGAKLAAAQRRREAILEGRETLWAALHLNYPQNARGFGPWANEQISFSERRGGSILGFGLIDNPLNESEAERRAKLAAAQNVVRANVKDMFRNGATKQAIRDEIKRLENGVSVSFGGLVNFVFPGHPELIPRDIALHYSQQAIEADRRYVLGV